MSATNGVDTGGTVLGLAIVRRDDIPMRGDRNAATTGTHDTLGDDCRTVFISATIALDRV
jgi:hypothetical protein